MTTRTLSFKTERDLILVNILSALLIAIIAFFPNSSMRIILGLPFILFFPGYVVISALFPGKKDLDIIERLAMSFGLSVAIASFIGLILNYTSFGIRLNPVAFSMLLFTFLISIAAMLRRRRISPRDVFAPLASINISEWRGLAKSEFIKLNNGSRTIKAIALIAFIFITLALTIIARTPPASGYEISIYDAYPHYFWYFLLAGITCGLCILVHQAFAEDEEKTKWWILGFSAILLTNFIILLLPIFRGYAFYGRGDELTHLGIIKDIISTGHFGKDNFYPVLHTLAASISYLTALDPKLLISIIPPIFAIFYMISIYLLATKVAQNYGQSLLITAFGSLMLYGALGSTFVPSAQAFFLLPFIFFLYYKVRTPSSISVSSTVPFILVLVLIPFFHPVMSLFLIFIFLCLGASMLLYKQIKKRRPQFNSGDASTELRGGVMNPSIIEFIIFITWYSAFSAFAGTARTINNWLLYQMGEPPIEEMLHILERANLTAYEFIRLSIKMYGTYLLYGILSIVICVIILKEIFSERKIKLNQLIFLLLFITLGTLTLACTFGDLVLKGGRVFKYLLFASTILNGLGIYGLAKKDKAKSSKSNKFMRKKLITSIVIIILVASMSIGLFNLFFSPRIHLFNQQVTGMELEGIGWFFDHRNQELLIDDIAVGQKRFADALLGLRVPNKNIRTGIATIPPDHFDYINNTMYGESYKKDRYFLNNKLSKIYYPKVHPRYSDQWRFTQDDFDRLSKDPGVNRIYINGEFEVNYIIAKKGSTT